MITYLQSIVLGALQGITELFPISSLGHSVILPKILGWNINQSANFFLIFLVATHLATALVLLGFFFQDWILIIKGFFRSIKIRKIDPTDTYARLGWLIVVSSIPAGILGLLFEDKFKALFASPKYAAIFLIFNGLLLFGAELLRKKSASESASQMSGVESQISTAEQQSSISEQLANSGTHSDEQISKISWTQSVKVGLVQCLSLIPGFSRTGATIGGGLAIGLNHENAARYSFLLATPIILAASLLKLPELLVSSDANIIGPIIVGSVVAAIMAYFSVRFLTKYFETKKLTPFAIYCVVAGIVASILLLFR